MAGITGLRYNFSRSDTNETPLFERQMSGDDFSEFQQLRGIIDGLHQRISKLERINTDLEARLEEQAKQSMAVETELINLDRSWKAKAEQLTQEINKWKTEYETEKLKNNRMRDHLSNTEKELYTILQRKHELMRGGPGIPSSRASNSKFGHSESGTFKRSDYSEGDLFQAAHRVSLSLIYFSAKY